MKRPLIVILLLSVSAFAQQASTTSAPVRILIAYHSQTGNTEKMAQAVRDGVASVPGVEVSLQRIEEVKDGSIPSYDGIIVGTPVHWSNMSADTKHFLDRVGGALWMAKTNGDGRTAGVFCTGGAVAMGKDMARLSIIAAFLTMRFAVIGGLDSSGFGTLGPEATTGAGFPGIDEKKKEEGHQFGERFARYTRQFRASR